MWRCEFSLKERRYSLDIDRHYSDLFVYDEDINYWFLIIDINKSLTLNDAVKIINLRAFL
jgi:hypothetical protein